MSQRSIRPVPLMSDAEAWERLPVIAEGKSRPLPAWARALAGSLPYTTTAMLRLDFLYRTRHPLDPRLSGKLRWVAAHAHGCGYAEACAAADLRRAGLEERDIRALAGDCADVSNADKEARAFARKLALAAHTITDEEVARLIELYGERQVVAMVLLLAYAVFQDLLLLALRLPPEEGAYLEPLDVRFARGANPAATRATLPRHPPEISPAAASPGAPADREWSALDWAELRKGMEMQRCRRPRIRIPSWGEIRAQLPPSESVPKFNRIVGHLVPLGYQPQLAFPWYACTETFRREVHLGPVLESSLFWVVTRSVHCFY